MAGSGCWSQGDSDLKTGLHAPLPDPATSQQVPHCRKLLCQSSQEQLPVGGIASAYRQKRCRVSTQPKFSGVFQQIVSGPQAKQQMETDSGLKQIESVPESGKIQNGDSGNYQNIPPTRGVDHVGRFQGCLLPYPNTGPVQEIPQISCTRSDIPIQSIALRTVHSSHGVHYFSQRSETNGHAQGYKDPPVPRRLVGKGRIIRYLPPTHTDVSRNVSGTGLAREYREVGAGTKAGFQFCRLPVRPQVRPGQTNSGPMGESPRENSSSLASTGLSGPQFMSLIGLLTATEKQVHLGRLHMRPIQWHLKNNWRVPESLEKFIPLPKSLHPHLQWWLEESNVLQGQPLHPIRHAVQVFTDASKEGWGAHLNEFTARGSWSVPESKLHINYLELKAVFLALREFQNLCVGRIVLVATDNTTVVAYINKEGGMRSGPLCALLWRILTWCSQRQVTLKAQHIPGRLNVIADKLSRLGQTIQTEWSLLPEIFHRICNLWHRPQIDLFATRFNHKLPQFVSPVPDPLAVAVDALTLPWENLDAYAFPPTAMLGKVVEKLQNSPCKRLILIAPGWPNMPCFLGLGDHVQLGPSQPAQPVQPVDTALQSDPSQESDKSQSSCMAPRATAIKEQGFSEAVAARIEAPQRRSTRSVYEAKWAIFTKWCVINQVDFRSPPVKSVANFLLHLFEVKKLQPSTIDGYRSAIADKLGNTQVNISKDENLTRLLESFHRDRPKRRRGIPSWNLSLVLHQLTKAPFEPLREASLKHLTFKTVFLLALGSGKRRSEIHAWQHKNIRHQADWSKVSLFPSPSFLSKNQLAKEGPESVAPVVIPALAPTLDRSLKPDRSLCPIRALRYYLDRTSTIRQGKELVFVSFKKGFDKDISPATISWIKQTVILCYELSDHHAHTLHQVKAHDVRAFAASKAFQSGVSLEQILAACHWKSHNTFTKFYLKDVAWADSELYHLGPVVAAQQIHQQAGT